MLRVFRLTAMSLALLAAALFFLTGCEGEQGPAGQDGTDGESGVLFDWTYVGGNGLACKHCHYDLVESVLTTHHTQAYDDLVADGAETNPYCVQCHTTGWDSPVNYGDTEITTYGPDLYGFDDYFGVNTTAAAERRDMLAGVQCEACHGAGGPNPLEFRPKLSFATVVDGDTSVGLCSPCHSGQLGEYATSGHGTVGGLNLEDFNAEFGRSSCAGCHTSEGFIFANDAAYADYTMPSDADYNFIGCVTCHDPHAGVDAGGNEHQLRQLGAVEIVYQAGYGPDDDIPAMSGYNNGQICAQCHHARRDESNVSGQIANGSSHFGPHGSPQMDMFIGYGSYEIAGYTYERGDDVAGHSTAVADACVRCHMVRVAEIHGTSQSHAFHTFQPDQGNCVGCHSDIANYTDFDYRDTQTEIRGLLDDLAAAIGYTDMAGMLDETTGWDATNQSGAVAWQREAAYAWYFVYNDGSFGIHNATYARSLLNNAITYANLNN